MTGEEPSSGDGARIARRVSSIRWRMVLGAALVTAAAGGVVFAHRAAQQPPRTKYLVLVGDVAAGEAITAEQLGAIAIDLPQPVDAIAGDDAESVLGRVASHRLHESGLLRESDLLEPERSADPDEVSFAVSFDPSRLPIGAFDTGDVVHLLATSPEGGTTTLTSVARVIRISNDPGSEGIGSGSSVRVLLSVPDIEMATSAIDAAVNDELTIVLGSPAASEAS